ncbi:hypothetical protein Indivirus_6_34 [Indivirus ILV1]|uniref:Uncharacterized protein n=1 Tax=Indivirus ILV1 TaxID=1977633 RepID=A0A1V0SEA0_9VIRU|nr:hypothetical protein Indivirus_6_34 [Indivirus ILV1]
MIGYNTIEGFAIHNSSTRRCIEDAFGKVSCFTQRFFPYNIGKNIYPRLPFSEKLYFHGPAYKPVINLCDSCTHQSPSTQSQ